MLFKDHGSDTYTEKTISDEELNKLLDRKTHFEELEKEERAKSGDEIDDYFSAFKVANVETNVEGLEKDE